MSILEIVKEPDPILRKQSEEVKNVDESLQRLMDNMLKTMYEANGIGLAATQVDFHVRLVVMDISEDRNDPKVFVNPVYKVLDDHKLFEFEEGCLSIPGFNEIISRPDKIELTWQDLSGKVHKDYPEGLLTVCIQHEIDHLEGKLMVDYVSALRRDRVRKRLLKEFKRK